MPKKLSERLIKWIRAQGCAGVDRGWRYLMVELAQHVEALVEAVEPEDTDVHDATIRNLREACHLWEGRCIKAEQELAKVQAKIERLRPLAEHWKLVLGMRQDSRLVKGMAHYWGGLCDDKGSWQTIMLPIHLDPADALRAIQEEGDAED